MKRCDCKEYPDHAVIKICDLGCYHSFCSKCEGQVV